MLGSMGQTRMFMQSITHTEMIRGQPMNYIELLISGILPTDQMASSGLPPPTNYLLH